MKNDQPQIFTRRQVAGLLGLPSFLALPFLSSAAGEDTLSLTAGSQPLPNTALMTQSGQALRLADLSGKALLINFWASWCAPCVVELPALEAAAVHLEAESIHVILVNLDRGGSVVAQPCLENRGIRTPRSAYDPSGSWARAFELRGLPTTLFIKPSQAGYAAHTGPAEWDSAPVLEQVRAYFN